MDTYEVKTGFLEVAIRPRTQGEPKSFERRVEGRQTARKTLGSDKIKDISSGAIANNSINATLLNYTLVSVTVSAGQTVGTSSVVASGVIAGYYPTAQDQIVKSIAIGGTTLTITLAAAATANNTFKVFVLAP